MLIKTKNLMAPCVLFALALLPPQFALAQTQELSKNQEIANTQVATKNQELLVNQSSNPVCQSTGQLIALPTNNTVTAKWLDEAWNGREVCANQTLLINYFSHHEKTSMPNIPNDYEGAWKLAHLVYFIGNYGLGENQFVSSKAGVELFKYGADAALIALGKEPNKVEGYYWYAVNLGSYGLAKGILASAANASKGMDALKKALTIDPSYHWYGSSRILGRYYQELPIIFGGSSRKAKLYLNDAITKAPEYDSNWLFLGRYALSQDDYKNAIAACTKALNMPVIDGYSEGVRYQREANECITKARRQMN